MSLDMQDAPEVANVSAQDIAAAANPIAITEIATGGNVSWMNMR